MNTTELRKIMAEVREKLDFLTEVCSLADDFERIEKAMEAKKILTLPDFASITRHVATACGVTTEEMLSRRRTERVAVARQIAMTFCYVPGSKNHSLQDVGLFFKRDHGTVIHAIKHIQNLRETDKAFDGQVRMIEARLQKAPP